MPGISKDAEGRCGFAWKFEGTMAPDSSFSMLHIMGRSYSTSTCPQPGDVVGIGLDQDSKVPHVSFYLNGSKLCLDPERERMLRTSFRSKLWKDQRIHVDVDEELEKGDFPIMDYDRYSLTPSICLFSAHQGDPPRVQFNFSGPFKHPVLG